jgi:hypothetical protein
MQASRPQIQEDNPDATFGDVARLVSSAWKSLSAKNRTIYTDLADVDKERSRREKDTWEKKRAARRARGEPSSQEEGQEEDEEDRSSGSDDDDDDERAVKKKRLSRTSRTKKKKRKKKRRRTQDETGVGRVLSSGVEESSSSEEEDDDARREGGEDGGDKDDDRPDISESVCFVCRLGGNLMMCDYKGCPKVYVQTGEKAKKIAQKLLRKLLRKLCLRRPIPMTHPLCLRSLSGTTNCVCGFECRPKNTTCSIALGTPAQRVASAKRML